MTKAENIAFLHMQAELKEMRGALTGLVNWTIILLETIEATSCDPDDEEGFEDALRGAAMFAQNAEKVLDSTSRIR